MYLAYQSVSQSIKTNLCSAICQ